MYYIPLKNAINFLSSLHPYTLPLLLRSAISTFNSNSPHFNDNSVPFLCVRRNYEVQFFSIKHLTSWSKGVHDIGHELAAVTCFVEILPSAYKLI
jgi:hypothetical protein